MRRSLVLALAIAAGAGSAAGSAAAEDSASARARTDVLVGVSCPSVDSCFAVGGAKVLATTDAGDHWRVVTTPPDVFDLAAIACRSATRCEAVGSATGDAGAVYGTRNGGTTWKRQSAALPGGFFLAISCPSATVCVATGNDGAVSVTADGGRTWDSQTLTEANLIYGITCLSTSVCQAVGYRGGAGVLGVALRTVDGGQEWDAHPLPASLPAPSAVACPEASTCTAVGQNTVRAGSRQIGVILRSRTAGSTWHRQPVPAGYSILRGIACVGPQTCAAVGSGPRAVLETVDGGETWTPRGPVSADLRGISCPSASSCVAVGAASGGRAAIYRTDDGGHAWHRQTWG